MLTVDQLCGLRGSLGLKDTTCRGSGSTGEGASGRLSAEKVFRLLMETVGEGPSFLSSSLRSMVATVES